MSLLGSLSGLLTPLTRAKNQAIAANHANDIAAQVDRDSKQQAAAQTRDNQRLSAYIADRQTINVMNYQADALRRIQNAEDARIKHERDQMGNILNQAFQAGAEIANQDSGNNLRQQLMMVAARPSSDNLAAVEAQQDITRTANQQLSLTSKIADVDYGTVKAEHMRTGSKWGTALADGLRAAGAVWTKGASLQYDDLLGAQEKSQQATQMFNQARNRVKGTNSFVQLDKDFGLNQAFSIGINTYFAKTADKERKQVLENSIKQNRLDNQDDYSRKSSENYFVQNARFGGR